MNESKSSKKGKKRRGDILVKGSKKKDEREY